MRDDYWAYQGDMTTGTSPTLEGVRSAYWIARNALGSDAGNVDGRMVFINKNGVFIGGGLDIDAAIAAAKERGQ